MKLLAILLTMMGICTVLQASDGESIDPEELLESCKVIEQDPYFRTMRNVLSQNPFYNVARNWDCLRENEFYFNCEVEPSFTVTDQKNTGRCWIYAPLNIVRNDFSKKIKTKKFEFSQSYLFFFDKIEKANFFLERIIATYQESLNSEEVRHLLFNPIFDDGYWHNFTNLVNKYGLVPKSIYPESETCNNSSRLNQILRSKLLKSAEELRNLLNDGESVEAARKEKQKFLHEIYQIVVLHMGAPPTEFNWSYRDKEKNHHEYKNLTPRSFAQDIVDFSLDEYVILVNSPREETPYYSNYQRSPTSYMIGGMEYIALNVPIDEIKNIAQKVVMEGNPICVAADVYKQIDPFAGILDSNLFGIDELYKANFSMTKGSRMQYRESAANHVMIFTGVHIEDEIPKRWKVENSWGSKFGNEGFFVMSDRWFDDYVFEIVVSKTDLTEELQELLKAPPILLDLWDPMGFQSDYRREF